MNQTQSPTHIGYGGQPARNTPEGGLPFTGLDVMLLIAVGFWLIAVGMALRLRKGRV